MTTENNVIDDPLHLDTHPAEGDIATLRCLQRPSCRCQALPVKVTSIEGQTCTIEMCLARCCNCSQGGECWCAFAVMLLTR